MHRLLLGFMGSTGFLSMWISNTATAAMMLPIAQAVLLEIKDDSTLESDSSVLGDTSEDGTVTPVRYTRRYDAIRLVDEKGEGKEEEEESGDLERAAVEGEVTEHAQDNSTSTEVNTSPSEDRTPSSVGAADRRFNRLAKALMLGVAYSANIGGTGTLTGTGPNIVLAGLARYGYNSVLGFNCVNSNSCAFLCCSDLGVNFGLWFIFATPTMILALGLSWIYLSAIYCDDRFVNSEQFQDSSMYVFD